MRVRPLTLVLAAAAGCSGNSAAPPPAESAGLARAALESPDFAWTRESAPGLRLYFLENSYAWERRDSLVRLTQRAREQDLRLLGADRFEAPIEVFYIESRAEMDSLVGLPVTGFADRDSLGIFLVTNPEWRSFERHELMHVLAHNIWGPAAQPSAWVEEGLAQFADGRCGGYSVDAVARAMTEENGAIPLDTLARRFRELDDLTAYLQAASAIGWLYETRGREMVRALWSSGLDSLVTRLGTSPRELMEAWRHWVEASAPTMPAEDIARIQSQGCG